MTTEENAQYEQDLKAEEEAAFIRAAKLLRRNYDDLFDALDAADLESIRYYTEEIGNFSRYIRTTKNEDLKVLCNQSIYLCKYEIEEAHNEIIQRRETRKEFAKFS